MVRLSRSFGVRDAWNGASLAWVEIYPPSSVANATASPRGEAFAPLSFFTTGWAGGNSEAWLLL